MTKRAIPTPRQPRLSPKTGCRKAKLYTGNWLSPWLTLRSKPQPRQACQSRIGQRLRRPTEWPDALAVSTPMRIAASRSVSPSSKPACKPSTCPKMQRRSDASRLQAVQLQRKVRNKRQPGREILRSQRCFTPPLGLDASQIPGPPEGCDSAGSCRRVSRLRDEAVKNPLLPASVAFDRPQRRAKALASVIRIFASFLSSVSWRRMLCSVSCVLPRSRKARSPSQLYLPPGSATYCQGQSNQEHPAKSGCSLNTLPS